MVRAHFNLGAGQTEGLRYEGLKNRLITSLGPEPLKSPIFRNNRGGGGEGGKHPQESTPEELKEEVNN